MAGESLVVWSYALAALLCGALAVAAARAPDAALPRAPLVAALALTALWALAVAGIDPRDVAARVAESARNIAWFGFLYALLARGGARPGAAVTATFALVALVCAATAAVAIAEAALAVGLGETRVVLRMIAAVAGLVLVHHVAVATGPVRGGALTALAALAALWSVDLALFVAIRLGAGELAAPVVARGVAMIGVGGLLAVAILRGESTLRPSRAVAVRSFSLAVVVAYVAAMALLVGLFAGVGGAYSRALQTAFVAGGTATLIGVFASPWLRAWLKVKVAKHLFDHRYDYRREWLRFTATLGRPDAGAAPLEQRVVQAIADLTDSPAGLLLVAADDALEPAGGWNWAGEGAALPAALAGDGARIVDLDAARAAAVGDGPALPAWLVAAADAWVLVPLMHLGRLTGAVVLARPPVARALDWEDYDLLRVAGRQGASYLAEHRAAAALGEAQRFEEFNRRFAFIVHDVKNLVSQLTLVARNAERHADNPAFRADMIATLQGSCGRMSALLTRLSQHGGTRADPPRATDVTALAQRVAARRRGQHPVTVAGDPAPALVDPARLEQIVGHLLQNAVEASPPGAPVTIAVAHDAAGGVTLSVADAGAGMTAAFVRDQLFRPFASTKPGGFGIGAFEARQLTHAMGGTIAVDSRPGAGTRFAVTFPAAPALATAA